MNQIKKNNYKKYICFSILEVLCLNPISVAAGVAAWVFATNFNDSFKSGRQNDFVKQKKHAKIALLIGLVGVILQAVLLFFVFSYIKTQKVNADELKVYHQFVLGDCELNIPISVEEFEQAGMCFEEDVEIYLLNPGETEYMGCSPRSFKGEGGPLAYVTIQNPTDGLIPLKEGNITGISIHNVPQLEGMKIKNTEMQLMNNVSFDTSEKALIKAFGKPDEKERDKMLDYVQYTWYKDGNRDDYYNFILIEYFDGKMMTVTIKHRN